MKSLKALAHYLGDSQHQIDILQNNPEKYPTFERKLDEIGLLPLTPTGIEIFIPPIEPINKEVMASFRIQSKPSRCSMKWVTA